MMIHRELKRFAQEDRSLTWRLLGGSCTAAAICAVVVVVAHRWWVVVAAAIAFGLVRIRLAMFFHDYMHKAIFKGSRLGGLIMHVIGVWTLTSPSLWLEWHQEHHWHTGKADATAVFGGFPMMTLEAWRNAGSARRLRYRIARHPLSIGLGYLTMFLFGMNIAPLVRKPGKRRTLLGVLALHVGLLCFVAMSLGWLKAVCLVVLPLVVAHAVLAYMLFAQHCFPGIDLRDDEAWTYDHAALRSSSYFHMSALMHWVTGNLGYHHVHHLNQRVPFYRLPEAMAALPPLQNPVRTTWRSKDMLACLRLAVWDPSQARMLTYDELRAGRDRRSL